MAWALARDKACPGRMKVNLQSILAAAIKGEGGGVSSSARQSQLRLVASLAGKVFESVASC